MIIDFNNRTSNQLLYNIALAYMSCLTRVFNLSNLALVFVSVGQCRQFVKQMLSELRALHMRDINVFFS